MASKYEKTKKGRCKLLLLHSKRFEFVIFQLNHVWRQKTKSLDLKFSRGISATKRPQNLWMMLSLTEKILWRAENLIKAKIN